MKKAYGNQETPLKKTTPCITRIRERQEREKWVINSLKNNNNG